MTDTEVVGELGHAYGDFVPNDDADCTHDGTETKECSRCGDRVNQTIPNTKTEHTVSEYRPNYDSTCTKNGTKTGYCSTCRTSVTVEDELRPASHRYNFYTKVEATCTVAGQEGRRCTRCGEEDEDGGFSTGYSQHKLNGNTCTVCGKTVQKGSFKSSGSPKTMDGAGSFGDVYIEFEVYSVTNVNDIDYKMFIYKPYTDSGRPDGNRYEVAVSKNNNAGFYKFTLWSVEDGQAVEFNGWLDISLYENDRCVKFVIGFNGSAGEKNYSFVGDKYNKCMYVYY